MYSYRFRNELVEDGGESARKAHVQLCIAPRMPVLDVPRLIKRCGAYLSPRAQNPIGPCSTFCAGPNWPWIIWPELALPANQQSGPTARTGPLRGGAGILVSTSFPTSVPQSKNVTSLSTLSRYLLDTWRIVGVEQRWSMISIYISNTFLIPSLATSEFYEIILRPGQPLPNCFSPRCLV